MTGGEPTGPAADHPADLAADHPADVAASRSADVAAGRLTDSAGRLVDAVDRLVGQVSHWTSSRWAASSAAGGSRAEVGREFAQRLADLEALASGRPPRPVPRLASDLAIPDQWRVLVRDLVRADPDQELLAEGGQSLLATRAAFFPNG